MPDSSKILRSLIFIILICGGLYFAKGFLVPILFGSMLAMLLTPISVWLEKKNINKALAALSCVIIMLLFASGIIAIMSWQVVGIADDADQITAELNKVPRAIQAYIDNTLGFSIERQKQLMKDQSAGMSGKIGDRIAGIAGSAATIFGELLLVIIYIFLFVFYRSHLQEFVLKLVGKDEREHASKIMASSSLIAQKYISGLGMMIGVLWILYGVGFSIIGVKHAIFFAILCGLLEIIPYIGNLTGSLLTAVMAFTQGGSHMALWVLAVYGVVQFTQTYLLEPLIVGAKVSINPLCTILVIILGEMLWGIPGMILGIPVLGILKIIFDNIPSLQAYGFLIGEVKEHKRPKKKSS